MSRETMTSRERVMTALSWQEPDRVPLQIYLTPEMNQKLQAHFGVKDVREPLGIDFRGHFPPYGGPIRPDENGLWFDMWGAGYRRVEHGSGGAYEEAEHLGLAAIETMDDFHRYPWPDPDAFDYSQIPLFCEKNAGFARCVGGAGVPDILNGVSRGRGMEQVMIDIATRDEVGMAIIHKRCDFFYEVMRRCLEAGQGQVDILCLGEDTGNQNGRMFSPRDWDEVFQPQLQRFFDLGHEFGAKVMMHSCGDTHELQPRFIEMGLDILDAMQPEPKGMQPIDKLRDSTRGKLAYCGLISTQQTLPYGSEDDCRAEARHRLDVIATGGGYIFAPAHGIQPDTPLPNVLAIYEEALGRKL